MKPHISPSQINMFGRCQMQYEYRYIEGIIRPPGRAAIRGRGTHAAIEADLTSKLATGALLPDEAIPDLARDATNAAWNDGVLLTREERDVPEDALRGQTVDSAIALAGLHHEELAPMIEPVHIEREVRIAAPNYPFDLMGIIDIQEQTCLRDTKTTTKSPPQNAADVNVAMTLYSLAVKIIDGKAPATLRLDHLVDTKTPKVMSQFSTRGPAEWQALLRRIEHIARAIEAGIFTPCSPDAWCCSEAWCGYWDMCPFGQKGRTRYGN